MWRFRIRLCRFAGVDVSLHPSWFLVLALFVWASTRAFADVYPGLPLTERAAMGVLSGVAFFSCLAVHELAHAVVARRFGIRVLGITLFMFGGMARISGEPASPSEECAVALAGPATSGVVGGVFALASLGATRAGWTGAEGVLATLALVNVGVALFNLVPGLPLDGGRLLRAGLWRMTGDHARSTRVAAGVGRALAGIMIAAGLVVVFRREAVGLWYVMLGGFLWFLARASAVTRALSPEGALALHDEDQAPQPRS